MTDVTARTRIQPGVSTGGQFAAEPKSETNVALIEPVEVDNEQLTALRDAAYERATALSNLPGGGSAPLRHLEELRAVAATVKIHHPDAVAFDIGESDQPYSTQGHVTNVYDSNGDLISDEFSFGLGDDEDLAFDMLWDAQSMFEHEAQPGVEYQGDERHGYTRKVTIADVLAPEEEPADEDVQAGAEARADSLIAGYRAYHAPLDASREAVVRSMLTDLVTWGGQQGVDVQRLLDDATKAAAQANGSAVRPSANDALDRITTGRPVLDAQTSDAELAQWARRSILPALEETGRL